MVKEQFQEVGHCGFEVTVIVRTENGVRSHAIRVSSRAVGPVGIFAVYALPEGIAVGTMELRGIGASSNPPPLPNCLQVFIGSDSEGRFGHLCQACGNYWRSDGTGMFWPMTCAYCGAKGHAHKFLTEGQASYVHACCELILDALSSGRDGETSVKLDDVADKVAKGAKRPDFYYSEESQQNKFVCTSCGMWNDILGKFGYCTSCGTWNGLQELEAAVERIRAQINATSAWEGSVQDLVSTFDSTARQYVKQMAGRVPLSKRRREALERVLFHQLKPRADDLKEVFDIDILKGLAPDDVAFLVMMFERRHVYEHNGGEADEKYIEASGDTSVRPKQVIIETRENAHGLAGLITKMGRRLHDGFHELFPPEEKALRVAADRSGRKGKGRLP